MPLLHAPHEFVFRRESAAVGADLVVRGVGYGPPERARGQATPASSQAVYEMFGVEVSRPYLVIVAIEDEALLAGPGTRLEWDGRELYQAAPRQTFSAHPVAAHSAAAFEERQYQGGG